MDTREIALQHGAVETVHVARKHKSMHNRQDLDYLLVLDFEATCWDKSVSKKCCSSEIIEFPVVLYDIKTNVILEEFQQYVMPTEKPILSDFCTQLTGIQQHTVDNGVPLGTCLMLFMKWLKDQKLKYNIEFLNSSSLTSNNRKCTFATWSDWDLKTCLHNECKRKRINKNEIFREWIDVRLLYKNNYKRVPKGLNGALNELGLTFDGNQHCGLHDARNTAKLIGKMVSDGILLKITKRI